MASNQCHIAQMSDLHHIDIVHSTGEIQQSVSVFTACWWFNIRYFSSSSNYVWQYCALPDQAQTT